MTDVLDYIEARQPFYGELHDFDCIKSCPRPGDCFDCPYRFIEDTEDLDELISEWIQI